jgi:hypothetical protein
MNPVIIILMATKTHPQQDRKVTLMDKEGTGRVTSTLLPHTAFPVTRNLYPFLYEVSTCVLSTSMFIVELITITKLWENPRCLKQINELRKMYYIPAVKPYSTTKKSEIMLFEDNCMELEIVILSEVIQSQKDKDHMFPSYVEARP